MFQGHWVAGRKRKRLLLISRYPQGLRNTFGCASLWLMSIWHLNLGMKTQTCLRLSWRITSIWCTQDPSRLVNINMQTMKTAMVMVSQMMIKIVFQAQMGNLVLNLEQCIGWEHALVGYISELGSFLGSCGGFATRIRDSVRSFDLLRSAFGFWCHGLRVWKLQFVFDMFVSTWLLVWAYLTFDVHQSKFCSSRLMLSHDGNVGSRRSSSEDPEGAKGLARRP